MAIRARASARFTSRTPARPRTARRRLIVGLLVLASGGIALQADATPGGDAVVRLTGSEASDRGLALGLARPEGLPEPVVTVDRTASASHADPRSLLDLAPGGTLIAIADQIGPNPTELVIGRGDGAQMRVPMPGILAGAFSPDGADLALIDGQGRLRVVSTADGSARLVADGPFLGPLTFEADGGVLLLAVASVEAPFQARLGRLDTRSARFAQLDDGELVYSGTRLADGSLAAVVHTPTGSIVRRIGGTATAVLAALEPGAIHVAVAPDGSQVAWELAGRGIFLRSSDATVRHLGSGSRPRFAPDGRALLVDDDGEATLLVTGSSMRIPLGTALAAFDGCTAGCPA
jgi:hypothetical protein